jgi:DnaJ family protein C protein 7
VKALAPDTPEIGQLLKEAKIELKKSMRVDYYKILGIDKDASQDEIKKAYKRTALKLRESSLAGCDAA